ncbi:MAG TPA: inositol monophosphatase family protein [Acidimicrobiales bacterium]|nr:inositol monophosphatase family protein [Acidimicrobiales bacterium]
MPPTSEPVADRTVEEVFGPATPGEDPVLAQLAAAALAAADGSARLAAEAFGAGHTIDTKSSSTDLVSEVDRASEAHITAVLADLRPDDGLLGEEGALEEGTTGIRWVIDPLDGTTNYLFGVPAWSISIAAERDGEPIVGLVADPAHGELWAAIAGRGARRNGNRLAVADGRSTLGTALVGTGFSYDADRRAWQAAVLGHVLPRVRDIRRFGSAALDLCAVAAGQLDGYYEWGVHAWDIAAGTIICREAGGRVDVHPGGLAVAATPSLQAPLNGLLADAGALVPPDAA